MVTDYSLIRTAEGLALHSHKKKFKPFYVNFLAKKMLVRSKRANLRSELLARAIGVHPRDQPTIIDATAGFGEDSFILAALGYEVTLIERSPIVHALLQDGLLRAKQDAKTAPIMERLKLIQQDAIVWLKQLPIAQRPDIIYLDPMYPERKKSASVKKNRVILQDLLGSCSDLEILLQSALACAKRRVVIKRPRLGGNLTQFVASFSLKGKTCRFDVFLRP